MQKVKKQINEDLEKIKNIVENGIRYPFENIEAIQERIKVNSNIALSKKEVSVGEWCQVHIPSAGEPFYAKVKHISKDRFGVLEGIYNYEGEDLQQRRHNSFPLDWFLPISEELGRLLEYANGNNKRMGGL
jgi:hypothetical protein